MQLSEASAAILGLPQSTSEITADNWRSHVHPDDLPRLDAERRRAFEELQPELVGELRIVRPGGEVRWIEARALITYDAAGRACRMIGVHIDVTERRQAEDHKSLLIAELDHRVKNILACVAVVAQHTRDAARSMDEFLKTLEGRLHSLANTHSLLSRNRWQGVSIAEIVRGELAPCMKDGNTRIDGPDIVLAAEATQTRVDGSARARHQCHQVWCPFQQPRAGLSTLARAFQRRRKEQAGARMAGGGRPAGGRAQFRWIRHVRDPRSHPL